MSGPVSYRNAFVPAMTSEIIGLRAFVAAGAIVITQEMNRPYYERIWANPHRLNPDKLTQNPLKPMIKPVADKMVLTDGRQVIELYHLKDFRHNDAMLIAYLPNEKILFEADGFNPPGQPLAETPSQVNPYTASLVANIERLKLDVERIIPVHYPTDGRKVTMIEPLTAVGKRGLTKD
jgi:glyoxylase-like metal-dependent hydrolase (beta-lactamase superfamily II)